VATRKRITAGLVLAAISAAGAAGATAHGHKTKKDDLEAGDTPAPVTDTSDMTPVAATAPAGLKAEAMEALKAEGYGPAEYEALSKIIDHESDWNPKATNPSSGAYGLFQALPASKMSSAGPDWRTNPKTQIEWGLKYIKERYGSPSAAWAFWQKHRWY
jgi:hypothetical protein